MEKLKKLTQMIEHPEQYSDEDWKDIFDGNTISDEQIEAEWKRFEQQHFAQHNRLWQKIAASFIGILMLSGVALAAVHIFGSYDDTHDDTSKATNTTTTVQAAEGERETKATPHTVIFENTELQQIIDSLTCYYKVKPAYRHDSTRHLRLYYEWDQHNSINDIANQISHFDHVSINLKGDSIIVE